MSQHDKEYFSPECAQYFDVPKTYSTRYTQHFTFPIPDSLLTTYSSFMIHVYDAWGNSAVDTSNFFSIYDNTAPNVDVLAPYENLSVPENETFNAKMIIK